MRTDTTPTWPCWVGQVELSPVDDDFGFAAGPTIVRSLAYYNLPTWPFHDFVACGGVDPPTEQAQPLLAILKASDQHTPVCSCHLPMSHKPGLTQSFPSLSQIANFNVSGLAMASYVASLSF